LTVVTDAPTESPTISEMLGGPTLSPTPAPTPSSNDTATPFDGSFVGADPNPTTEEFEAAEVNTCDFLRTFFEDFYSESFETTQDLFLCEALLFASDRARISFAITLGFGDDSFLIPTVEDVDLLVLTAFSEPTVNQLIATLIEAGGAFGTTTAIIYSVTSEIEPVGARGSSSNSTESVAISVAPFWVTYAISGVDPSETQQKDAESITLEYLEQFLWTSFDHDFKFEALSGFTLDSTASLPRVSYSVTILFLPGYAPPPTKAEVERVVQTAFQQPMVQALVLELRTLPETNPFSSTSSVSLSIPASAIERTPIPVINIIAGVGSLTFITIAMLFTRKRSRYQPIDQSMEKGEMPCNNNLMAFMDRESDTHLFASTQSVCTLSINVI